MSSDKPRRGCFRQAELMAVGKRRCPRCERAKPVAEFSLQRGRSGGYFKPCRLEVNQQWRARHHDELRARRRAAYAEPHLRLARASPPLGR